MRVSLAHCSNCSNSSSAPTQSKLFSDVLPLSAVLFFYTQCDLLLLGTGIAPALPGRRWLHRQEAWYFPRIIYGDIADRVIQLYCQHVSKAVEKRYELGGIE